MKDSVMFGKEDSKPRESEGEGPEATQENGGTQTTRRMIEWM